MIFARSKMRSSGCMNVLDPAANGVSKMQKHVGLVSTKAWELYHSKHSLLYGISQVGRLCGICTRPIAKARIECISKTNVSSWEVWESLGIFLKWSHACGCNGISPSLDQAFIHTAVPSGRQEQVYKRQSTKTQTLPSHQRTCAWCEALHPLRHTPPSRHEMFEERPTRKLVRDGAQAESEGPGWMKRRNL